MFEKFTEGAIKVIMLSQEEARRMGHNFVGTEQLLLGVIGQRHGIGARALKKLKVTLKKARKEIELYIGRGTGFVASEIPFTPRAKRVLEMAVHEGKDLGQNFVGTEHILLALIAESDGVAMRTLDKLNVDIHKLRNLILTYIEETQEEILRPLTQAEKFLLEREKKGSPTPTLDEYAENITKEAIDGNLDPVIGREKEIDDVIAVLARRTKNNPVLIGEPGVGKTSIVEGLAQLIHDGTAPRTLLGKKIYTRYTEWEKATEGMSKLLYVINQAENKSNEEFTKFTNKDINCYLTLKDFEEIRSANSLYKQKFQEAQNTLAKSVKTDIPLINNITIYQYIDDFTRKINSIYSSAENKFKEEKRKEDERIKKEKEEKEKADKAQQEKLKETVEQPKTDNKDINMDVD